MKFTLYNCDVGIKLNGVNYDFTHVDQVEIEDPERNQLTRGANAGNKTGLVFKTGLKDPKQWTLQIMDMNADLKAAFDAAFNDQSRLDVFAVSRDDGSSKMLKQAILCNIPQQLTLNDTPESLNVQLIFQGFDSNEVHKS